MAWWDGQQLLIWTRSLLDNPGEAVSKEHTLSAFLPLQTFWGLLVATEVC